MTDHTYRKWMNCSKIIVVLGALLCAFILMLEAKPSGAQSLPSPTYNNTTVRGTLFAQTVNMTAAPAQVYNWAGVPTYVGDLRLQPGARENDPEIQNVSVIHSTAGSSDELRNFKMNAGNICVNEVGGASCWNINNVLQIQPGAGSVGATGIEQDVINLNKDYLSPNDNPLVAGFYATGAETSAYYSNCGLCVTGSGPTWAYGILGSQFSKAAATVTFTNGTPGTVNLTAHGYKVGQAVVFRTTGVLPTGLTAGVRYYVLSAGLTTNTFRVSASLAGTAVNFNGSPSGVQTASGANVYATAFIGDVSNSPVSYLVTGNHTIGINLAGGTYTQASIVAPNFSVDPNGNVAANVVTANANISLNNPLFIKGTPVISGGFGGSPSIVSSNGTATFRVNVGSGGAAGAGTIGLPTASNGWNCFATDVTTQNASVFVTKQTTSTTTSVTFTNFSTAGTAAAWAANDILAVSCNAY